MSFQALKVLFRFLSQPKASHGHSDLSLRSGLHESQIPNPRSLRVRDRYSLLKILTSPFHVCLCPNLFVTIGVPRFARDFSERT